MATEKVTVNSKVTIMNSYRSSYCDNVPEAHELPEAKGATAPQLLVSVRNTQEAQQAVAGGTDWIDLKAPQQGPLGPVDIKTAREVAEVFSTSHPLSAAAGELLDWQSQSKRQSQGKRIAQEVRPSLIKPKIDNSGHHLMGIPGIRLLKLGLAGCDSSPHWRDQWCGIQAEVQQAGKQLVAVAYADWKKAAAPHPKQILEHASSHGCETLLIDTYCKSKGTVLDCLCLRDLTSLLECAHKGALRTVLAGSLSINSLSQLIALPVSLIAVRGAVCTGGRNGTLQKDRIKQFRHALRALPWGATPQ
jgi:uncharacterized protein (UPF0264 family)